MAETQQEEEKPGWAGRVGAVWKKKKKKGGVTETTGIRLECYSKKMEKKNTEIL